MLKCGDGVCRNTANHYSLSSIVHKHLNVLILVNHNIFFFFSLFSCILHYHPKELVLHKATSFRKLLEKACPEKDMATHFSILAGRIPWTEEHGGLQSTGQKRLSAHTHTAKTNVYKQTLMQLFGKCN